MIRALDNQLIFLVKLKYVFYLPLFQPYPAIFIFSFYRPRFFFCHFLNFFFFFFAEELLLTFLVVQFRSVSNEFSQFCLI